tara:strand:- start:66916 stop:67284 length:369 start_codon:yes stop_codon:yes gene_type:complete
MGYEVKMFVGKRFPWQISDGPNHLMTYGTFDLCKVGDCHIGDCEGDLRVEVSLVEVSLGGDDYEDEDCYGEKLYAIPLEVVLEAIKKDCEDSDYRRFKVGRDFLQSFKDNFKEQLHVVLYGY